jgi:uncharacterized protein
VSIKERYELLKIQLREFESPVVAFSGGVDSSLLLAAASEGREGSVTAVTWQSEVIPAGDVLQAEKVAALLGVSHRIERSSFLENRQASANDRNRCYYCRRCMYEDIKKLGCGATLLEGANLDDLSETRPGLAAAREADVIQPFIAAGLNKVDIRNMARLAGLPNWDKEASPCLATRIEYGVPVTAERLRKIEAAEAILKDLSFLNVRVRLLRNCRADIEVAKDQVEALRKCLPVVEPSILSLGFDDIVIDPEGYRTGKMDEESRDYE